MKKSVTMKFEVAENGLIVRKREGNKWGERAWVMDFRSSQKDPFGMYGESTIVGDFVREALFGKPTPKPVVKAEPKSA